MLRYERIIIQIVIIVILILTNCIVSMMMPSECIVVYLAGEETVLLFHDVSTKGIYYSSRTSGKQLCCFIMYILGFVNVVYLLKERTGCRKR